MKLIIILICLIGLRYLHLGRTTLRYRWFDGYIKFIYWFFKFLRSSFIILLLLLAPLLVGIYFLQNFLPHGIYYILDFIVGIVVLWYCLWPVSFSEELETNLANYKLEKGADAIPTQINTRPISEAMLANTNSRIMAVIFWYVVFGLFGAVLYRVISQVAAQSDAKYPGLGRLAHLASFFEGLLDWIPARLTGIGYVFAGDFVNGFSQWLLHFTGGLRSNRQLLIATGLGAMNLNREKNGDIEEARQVLRLIDRSLVIWVVLITIFTLGTWDY